MITTPTPKIICNLDCNEVLSKAKTYYDTIGQWKNVFTMTPNKANKVNDTQCDISYTYNPTVEMTQDKIKDDLPLLKILLVIGM